MECIPRKAIRATDLGKLAVRRSRFNFLRPSIKATQRDLERAFLSLPASLVAKTSEPDGWKATSFVRIYVRR